MSRFVVISGCSGGGKSTLLSELQRRGHSVVAEPGRRVVHDARRHGTDALPWLNLEAFLRRAMQMALADLDDAGSSAGWVFFDRGVVDAASALQSITGEPFPPELRALYHRRVFLAPPWPEIYAPDEDRRHDITTAVAEYDRLGQTYALLGYEVVILPRSGVAERADFVLQTLGETPDDGYHATGPER